MSRTIFINKNFITRKAKVARTIYINRKDEYGNLETVDEFTEGRKYAREMLNCYQEGDRSDH